MMCTYSYGSQTVNLEKIKVTTASLGEEKNIDDVQASVQVLDEKFIEKYNSRSLPQLLNTSLGINVNDTGSTSSVSFFSPLIPYMI